MLVRRSPCHGPPAPAASCPPLPAPCATAGPSAPQSSIPPSSPPSCSIEASPPRPGAALCTKDTPPQSSRHAPSVQLPSLCIHQGSGNDHPLFWTPRRHQPDPSPVLCGLAGAGLPGETGVPGDGLPSLTARGWSAQLNPRPVLRGLLGARLPGGAGLPGAGLPGAEPKERHLVSLQPLQDYPVPAAFPVSSCSALCPTPVCPRASATGSTTCELWPTR